MHFSAGMPEIICILIIVSAILVSIVEDTMAGAKRFRTELRSRLLFGLVFLMCAVPILAYCDDGTAGGDNSGDSSVVKVAVGSDDASSGNGTALPDLFTGAMSYRIPIEVPPGRNGMEPDLALAYSSRNGCGWVGMGWELEVGAIERSTRNGLDYTKDDYVLRRSGSVSELVYDANTATYHTKIESDFMRIQKQGDGSFVATNKLGIKFFFGATSDSRLVNAPGTFKWSLSSIVDTFENTMSYAYSTDNNQIYLDHINYNGNKIKFYLEDRTDVPDIFATNFLIKNTKRLTVIDIIASDDSPSGNSRVRTYKLAYKQGNNTNRSLLTGVTQFGKNADVTATGIINNENVIDHIALFNSADYGDSDDNTFALSRSPAGFTGGWSSMIDATVQLVGDFNGDGKTDILKVQKDGNNELMLSNGDGTFTALIPADANGSPYSDWKTGSPTILAGDFDGDGKTEILIMKSDGTNNIYHYTSDGKFDVQPNPLGSAATWQDPAIKLVDDFDGDGKADVLIWQSNGVAKGFMSKNGYALSNYNLGSWTQVNVLVGSFVSNGRASILLLQSNGDNRLLVSDSSGNFTTISHPTGIGTMGGWTSLNIKSVTGDFNGDGLTDVLRTDDRSSNSILFESKGDGTFVANTVIGLGNAGLGSFADGYQINYYVGDFNGDGKSDVLKVTYFDRISPIDPIMKSYRDNIFINSTIYQSNGDGTFTVENYGDRENSTLKFQSSYFNLLGEIPLVVILGDYIGNGKTGILGWCEYPGVFDVNYLYTKVNDKPLDVLRSFKNHIGGTVSMDYTASTRFPNNQIPFPLWAVTSITTSDGNGISSQSIFDYSDGYYYALGRDFRGFNHVTAKGPVGSNGERKLIETWFHQGNDTDLDMNVPNVEDGYMKGKPYRVRITDGNGNTFSEVETVYAGRSGIAPQKIVSSLPPWHFNPPKQVDTFICDGNVKDKCKGTTLVKHLRTDYVYDYLASTEYGNLSVEYHYGDADAATGNDKYSVYRTYSPNSDNGIVGLPASETIYQGLDTTTPVASTSYYYDGISSCDKASTSQTPDKGKLTRTVRWLHYDTNQDTSTEERMAYDPYGNQVCRRDAKGNITTIGYDPSNTFPISATSPPVPNKPAGLTTTTSYYGVNGVIADKGLYGQVKSVTDASGATITTEYDPLGRKAKELRPDTTWTSWAYNNFGTVGSQYVRVSDSNGLWKDNYFDGFGRTCLEKSLAPESKTVAVSTIYDTTGAVHKKSLPYFDGQETTPRYIVTDRDALGRATRTGQESPADYIRTLTCYNNEVTVTIDPNNHRRRETRDTYGRLIKVQEYTGSIGTCSTEEAPPSAVTLYATTTYAYDVLGNLLTVTDAKNQDKVNYQTVMKYDSLGRKRYMSDPDMGVWTYDYDDNGNLTTQTDANQQTIAFFYDALNRLEKKYYGPNLVLTNTYDGATSSNATGRLFRMADLSGQTVYSYDTMGRITSSTRTINGTSYTLGFSYPNGRLGTITYPDNETVSYTYDAGTLKGVTGYVLYSNFDALGRPWNAAYGSGGASSLFSYDDVTKRLATLSVLSPNQGLLIDNSYGYDNKGNIKSITDHLDIGSYWGKNWDVWRVGATTLAGGGVSAAAGGDWKTGALFAFGISTAAYAYNSVVGSSPRGEPGEGVRYKTAEWGKEMINPTENNFGLGNDDPNLAIPHGGAYEGSPLSNTMNQIPYMNAVATWHDTLGQQFFSKGAWMAWGSPLTMLPAGVSTYGAAMANSPLSITPFWRKR